MSVDRLRQRAESVRKRVPCKTGILPNAAAVVAAGKWLEMIHSSGRTVRAALAAGDVPPRGVDPDMLVRVCDSLSADAAGRPPLPDTPDPEDLEVRT